MDRNLEFIREVSAYFMDFLQSNFKSNRLPKRYIRNKNDKNMKIGVSVTSKYDRFDIAVKKLIAEKMSENSTIAIKKGVHTQKPSKETLKLFENLTNKINEEKITELNEKITNSIRGLVEIHKKDPELIYELAEKEIIDSFSQIIIKDISESIEPLIQSQSIYELDSLYTLEQGLIDVLTSSVLEQVQSLSNLLITEPEADILTQVSSVNDVQSIKKNLNDYFSSFNVNDLFLELTELNSSFKILDKQELYLYFGELKFMEKKFPIFYLPIELKEDIKNGEFKIEFQNEIFINKKVIDFATQEFNKQNSSVNLIQIIDRKLVPSEEENLLGSMQELISKLQSTFRLEGALDLSSYDDQKLKSIFLEANNKISFAVFDKSDEALVNDYEEILINIQQEDSEIGEMFRKIIADFLMNEPEPYIQPIEDSWRDTPISDRLNYVSPIPLNTEQQKILRALNTEGCKYVWVEGPPGTGKSHTISAIAFDHILHDKSILILSDKKEALDVVEDKITQTLNKVRLSENFQNPILRLGKQGNTYGKILTQTVIDEIRSFHSAQKSELGNIEESISDAEYALKNKLNTDLNFLNQIDNEKIREYLILHNNLDDGPKNYDEEELKKIQKKINSDKISRILEILDDQIFLHAFKTMPTTYLDFKSYPKSLKEIQTIAAIYQQIQDCLSYKTNKRDINSNIKKIRSIKSLKKQNLQEIDDILSEYIKTKNKVWPFGKKNKIEELNFSLTKLISFEERKTLDTDFDEIKNIVGIISLMQDFIKEKIDNKFSTLKRFLEIIKDPIFEDCHNKGNDMVNEISEFYKILQQAPETKIINKIDEENIYQLKKVDFAFITSNKLTKKLEYEKMMKDIFTKVNDFDFNGLQEEKQERYINQMAYNIDGRIIDFFDNNRNFATTLKKIVRAKKPFPTDQFGKVKSAFPCIIASVRDFAGYIGLKKDLFDLIIIDEASQVSIAQAFPALIRAKKVLVLGDKKQFSNVQSGQASIAVNNHYMDSLLKSFRSNIGKDSLMLERVKNFNIKISILDFFNSIANYTTTLKKHFRGYKEHISYCSKNFYKNSLEAIRINSKPIDEIIKFTILEEGDFEIGNTNTNEANFIIQELEKMCELKLSQTVGIITPFTDQQKLITEMISKHPERDYFYENLRLKIMTFDSCQGEERETIYYSMVANNSKDKLNTIFPSAPCIDRDLDEDTDKRCQRLNVGFSRVQECMHFVLSKKPEDYRNEIGNAIRHFHNTLEKARELPKESELDPNSPMEKNTLNWIQQTKFFNEYRENIQLNAQFKLGEYLRQLNPHYHHPKYKVDFLLLVNSQNISKKIIIEYDGLEYHFQNLQDINEFNFEEHFTPEHYEREKILESYGYEFIRLNRFNTADDPVKYLDQKFNEIIKSKVKKKA